MKKVFYVCDSYHTTNISDYLLAAFPKSTVYTDSTIISSGNGDLVLETINPTLKSFSEKKLAKDEVGSKVDYFVLSAKLILDGSINPNELKAKYGSANSKTIAVSTMSVFLDQVKDSVDTIEDKGTFMNQTRLENYSFLKRQ